MACTICVKIEIAFGDDALAPNFNVSLLNYNIIINKETLQHFSLYNHQASAMSLA